MKPNKALRNWIRFQQSQRGFRRLTKRELPHFDSHIVAYTGVIEALKREKKMTWDEIRTWMESSSGCGMETVIYEALARVMERPEWENSVREWRELDRAKETQAALDAWRQKKRHLPRWKSPEINGGYFL